MLRGAGSCSGTGFGEGPGQALELLCSSLSPQDTGLYYHRYLQEVINVLETDGHFREKLQAANSEDIKVRLGAGDGRGRALGGQKDRVP